MHVQNNPLTLYFQTELALFHFGMVCGDTVVLSLVLYAHTFNMKCSIGVLNEPFFVKLVAALFLLAPKDLGFGVACRITVKPEMVVYICRRVLWPPVK